MTTARPFGAAPTTAERVLQLEHLVAELLAWKAAVEARDDVDEDGAMPQPLSASWKPLKLAAASVGYSSSMLRKLSDGCRAQWWQYRGGRIWIDTGNCPCRR